MSISPDSYRYPGEQNAFLGSAIALAFVAFVFVGFTFGIAIVAIVIGLIALQVWQGSLKGSSIRVNATNFARLDRMLSKACESLGQARPTLHVKQDPALNAFAMGFPNGSIFLNSALVEQMTDEELQFIIGHELGHLHCGHTRWNAILGPMMESPPFWITLILGSWHRKCELSADRAGLLVSKSVPSAVTALMKLAGGSIALREASVEDFIAQATNLDATTQLGELLVDHPYATNRVRELITFSKTECYRRATGNLTQARLGLAPVCLPCGISLPEDARFCPACGIPVLKVSLCETCGANRPADARFCASCGRKADQNTEARVPEPVVLGSAAAAGATSTTIAPAAPSIVVSATRSVEATRQQSNSAGIVATPRVTAKKKRGIMSRLLIVAAVLVLLIVAVAVFTIDNISREVSQGSVSKTVGIGHAVFGEREMIQGHFQYAQPVGLPCESASDIEEKAILQLEQSGCSAVFWKADPSGFGHVYFVNWQVPKSIYGTDEVASVIVEDLQSRYPRYVQRIEPHPSGSDQATDPPPSVITPAEAASTSPSSTDASDSPTTVANQASDYVGSSGASEQQPDSKMSHQFNTEGLRLSRESQPDYIAARKAFEQAVKADPTNVEALNNLGDTLGKLGEFRSAEGVLLKVLALAPDRRVAHGNLGYVQAKLGKVSEAAGQFCQYVRSFKSAESGKKTLIRVMVDPDPNVQSALRTTVGSCSTD